MSRDRIIQLQECAEELGFETIQQALDAGYHEAQDLVAGTFTLEKIGNMVELEKAHEAWLKERDEVIKGLERLIALEKLLSKAYGDEFGASESIIKDLQRAIDFIRGIKSE